MKKTVCLVLVMAMLLSTAAFAADSEIQSTGIMLDKTLMERSSRVTPISGQLLNAGDSIEYQVEIDHSVYPEFVLYAFTSILTGDSDIEIYNENNAVVGAVALRNSMLGSISSPKGFTRVKNDSGEVITYKIVASTKTGNAGYAFNLGTIDDFVALYGGDNFTTVTKNVPSKLAIDLAVSGHFKGCQALLNTGEWFHYKADGETYITACIINNNSLAFDVYGINETGLDPVYKSCENDRTIIRQSPTLYEGYVEKKLSLENGKEYLIRFYSTSEIRPEKLTDYYNIYIGIPYITTYKMNIKSSTFTIPANTTKTFTFEVSDIPKSARLGGSTSVDFSTNSFASNIYITSCIITAPNKYSFSAVNGSKQGFAEADILNFINSPNNVPINGKWTVSIRTSKTLSDVSFRIKGYARIIVSNDEN